MEWQINETKAKLPERPDGTTETYVRCLIFVDGQWEIGMWNTYHLCWDDADGDDWRYDPYTPTSWASLPPKPPVQP